MNWNTLDENTIEKLQEALSELPHISDFLSLSSRTARRKELLARETVELNERQREYWKRKEQSGK